MKKTLIWLGLLAKRIYKKATFLLILVLIPLTMVALSLVSNEKSGFVSIALVSEGQSTAVDEIISKLLSEKGVVYFEEYSTAGEAIEAVERGRIDSAWIFPADFEQKTKDFASSPSAQNAVVTVVEREQNVALRLSREKLSSVIYKYVAKDVYINYIRDNIPKLNEFSNEELTEHYDGYIANGKLFEYVTTDGNGYKEAKQAEYLTAPARGLLSVIVMLCSFSTVLYYMKDEEKGTFDLLPIEKRPFVELAMQFISVGSTAFVMMISLILTGLGFGIAREIFVTFLYIIAAILFATLCRGIFKKIKIFAPIIPLLLVVMIGVCPVFFSLWSMRHISAIFPPTYYVKAMSNNSALIEMIIYIVVLAALNAVINIIRIKKTR